MFIGFRSLDLFANFGILSAGDTDAETSTSLTSGSVLPGVEIIAAIRRVATVTALALMVYVTFTRGSAVQGRPGFKDDRHRQQGCG